MLIDLICGQIGGPCVQRFCSPIDDVRGKSQGLGCVAQRRACAVGHHIAHHPDVFFAVLLVHVLDHLLSAIGRKVDVDVGYGTRSLIQEAFKEQIVFQRVDRGDVQQVGHQRVGCRAPPLAANALVPGKADDVPHDEKIADKADVEINDLCRWNKIKQEDYIHPGQTLVIFCEDSAIARKLTIEGNKNRRTTLNGAQTTRVEFHTVKAGENLSTIARKHGVSVKQLIGWNNLKEPYIIKPGQKLKIIK